MSKGRILIGSPTLMRETNARTILGLLKTVDACSRADLARQTGMSAPTVANVVSDLDDLGLIDWTGEGTSSGGRRPDNLRLKAAFGYLAGVDVTTDGIRILITDLKGTFIGEQHEPLRRAARNPNGMIEVLRATLWLMLQKHGIPRQKLLAMTVGIAGITNVRDGIVISVAHSEAWRDVPLRDLLRRHFSCQLQIDNDTNLAAIGEHSYGAAQAEDSFIFILISARSGVGAGIFVNGEIVYGSSWSAGEIGYLQVPNISSTQPALYEYGGLEQILSGPGILTSWNAIGSKSGATGKVRKAINVLELALAGNASALKIVHQRARLLRDVVLNLSLTLNPSLFVFGGDLGTHPAILGPLVEMLRTSEIAAAQVLESSLGDSAVAWGAIAVALRASEQNLYRPQQENPKA